MPQKDLLTFSVPYVQVLDEEGRLDKELDPNLSDEQALKLYRDMVFAREADDRMLKLQRQGRLGTFPPCIGQEAAHCAPTMALGENDWFCGAFREVGARMMRGEPLHRVLLYYNGWEEGNYSATSPRTLPIYVIIASQMLHATGLAYASRYKGEDAVAVAFVGDGGTSEGDFHEALNFASVWKVPVVFICQNNHWAISVPLSKQTSSRSIAQKAIAYDMPTFQVDGNDPLAMYRVGKQAIDAAREGKGPTFIEAVTYRLKMHTTADDPTKYRQEAEVEPWYKRDPLHRFKIYLTQHRNIWDEEKEEQLRADAKAFVGKEVEEFERIQNETAYPQDEAFRHVFGTEHAIIQQQHAEYRKLSGME